MSCCLIINKNHTLKIKRFSEGYLSYTIRSFIYWHILSELILIPTNVYGPNSIFTSIGICIIAFYFLEGEHHIATDVNSHSFNDILQIYGMSNNIEKDLPASQRIIGIPGEANIEILTINQILILLKVLSHQT